MAVTDPIYRDAVDPADVDTLGPDDPNVAANNADVDDHEQSIGELVDDDDADLDAELAALEDDVEADDTTTDSTSGG